MADSDRRTAMGNDKTTTCTNRDVGNVMVIDTIDSNRALRCVKDSHISTGETTIGTAIDKLVVLSR